MLSNTVEKLIRKLRQKKYRYEYGLFVAEGPKVVEELIKAGLTVKHLFAVDHTVWEAYGAQSIERRKLNDISQLDTPNGVLGVFEFPQYKSCETSKIKIILDRVNDPGNLGTIIRTSDWFGVDKIYCTTGTTDVFNAKCVQSTMGSIARVEIEYLEEKEIEKITENHTLLVADMEGMNINYMKFDFEEVFLVMGSESHGPSDFWKERAQKITIPKTGESPVESLNVAVATAIILSRLSLPFS